MSKKTRYKQEIHTISPEILEYAKYVEQNASEIAKRVKEQFETEKENLRQELLNEIRNYLTPVPKHYVLGPETDSYGNTREIFEYGFVDLKQTVHNFLSKELTGETGYSSGFGSLYTTYGDVLFCEPFDPGYRIARSVVKKCIDGNFKNSSGNSRLFNSRDESTLFLFKES